MLYLDASALVTFVVRRPNKDKLDEFLARQPTRTCTSTVGLVETVRNCARIGSFPGLMTRLLRDHIEIELSPQVRDAAANLPPMVHALDAIHVASAELLGTELVALVTYDKKMAEAARQIGLPVAMPGAE